MAWCCDDCKPYWYTSSCPNQAAPGCPDVRVHPAAPTFRVHPAALDVRVRVHPAAPTS
jgi:hypothetical protein